MPIRLRLIAWYSSVFALSLIGFAVVIWLGTRAAMENDIDLWLKHQADGLENFLQHGTSKRRHRSWFQGDGVAGQHVKYKDFAPVSVSRYRAATSAGLIL